MKARFFVLALLIAIFALPAVAMPHVHLGGIQVGVGYSHFSGPYYPYGYWGPYPPGFYPGWGYGGIGWYDPFWYGSPMAYTIRGADKGEVHLKDAAPQAEVYIDGAYAGVVKDLRTLWLAPGAYNVEVRTASQAPVQKRIYVLTGKSLNVRMAEVKQ